MTSQIKVNGTYLTRSGSRVQIVDKKNTPTGNVLVGQLFCPTMNGPRMTGTFEYTEEGMRTVGGGQNPHDLMEEWLGGHLRFTDQELARVMESTRVVWLMGTSPGLPKGRMDIHGGSNMPFHISLTFSLSMNDRTIDLHCPNEAMTTHAERLASHFSWRSLHNGLMSVLAEVITTQTERRETSRDGVNFFTHLKIEDGATVAQNKMGESWVRPLHEEAAPCTTA